MKKQGRSPIKTIKCGYWYKGKFMTIREYNLAVKNEEKIKGDLIPIRSKAKELSIN